MKRSIFSRLFLSYLVITVSLSALIILFTYRSVRTHYIKAEEENLRSAVSVLKWQADRIVKAGDLAMLDRAVKEAGKGSHIRFTVIDRKGRVLADSQSDPAGMDNHLERPEVARAAAGSEGIAVRYSNTVKEDMLYLAIPGANSVIRASLSLKKIRNLSDSLALDIAGATLLVLILSLAGALLYSRSISLPIRALADASMAVAGGKFGTLVNTGAQGELKALEENFNTMSSEIKNLLEDIREKKGQLDAVVGSISEGMVVLDAAGRVSVANESFRRISGLDCAPGRFYHECFLSPEFNDMAEFAIRTGRHFTRQVTVNDRTYLASASFLPGKMQTAIILSDITEYKRLEQIKKDLIANVSHELRTPLAAIKGFAETLGENPRDKEAPRYLEVIKRHAERLTNIVNDLLTLSQLEEDEAAVEKERVELKLPAMNAAKMFEQAAEKKGIKLHVEIPEKSPAVNGDSFRLEQVFINLVDNAVKYTEKGAVAVRLLREGKDAVITVEDTGPGIPKEHLARIFERFYVVDKSRSRKLGGTGLGLSIVKHIINLHGGTITVESEPGKGSTFTVRLPLA